MVLASQGAVPFAGVSWKRALFALILPGIGLHRDREASHDDERVAEAGVLASD